MTTPLDVNLWFVTNRGKPLTKPPSKICLHIQARITDILREHKKKENAFSTIYYHMSRVYRIGVIKVLPYSHLVFVRNGYRPDTIFPDLNINGGFYTGYGLESSNQVKCKVNVDQETNEKSLEVTFDMYNNECKITCRNKEEMSNFDYHCLHASYVILVYIGILKESLQAEHEIDICKLMENIKDKMDFTGAAFYSVEKGIFSEISLIYTDEENKTSIEKFAKKIYDECENFGVIGRNIGKYRYIGNKIEVDHHCIIIIFSIRREMLQLRFYERQFIIYVAAIISFRRLMRLDSKSNHLPKLINLFDIHNHISIIETKEDGTLIHHLGNYEMFSNIDPTIEGFQHDSNNTQYYTKCSTYFDQYYNQNINISLVEQISNFYPNRQNNSFQLKDEKVIENMFNFFFVLDSCTELARYLGYKHTSNLTLNDLINSYDRKILELKHPLTISPIRLRNAKGKDKYFIYISVHTRFLLFIEFESFLSIQASIDHSKNYIPFNSDSNIIFWCIAPLTRQIFGMIGNNNLIEQYREKNINEILQNIHELDKSKFHEALSQIYLSKRNSIQFAASMLVENNYRNFEFTFSLSSGWILFILANDVTEHKQMINSAAELSQFIDIGLLYSNVRMWNFIDSRGENLVYASLPIAHKPFLMNWETIESNVVLESQELISSQIKQFLNNQTDSISVEIPFMIDKIRWFMMRGLRHNNQSNEITGILVDVTELKGLASQAELEKQRAEEALTAKSRFLANMSHEIRTPLNGMSGLLELLEMTKIPPSAAEIVQCIHASFDKLLDLLNDSLDLAKIEQNKFIPQKILFNTFEAIDSIFPVFQNRFKLANDKFQVYVEPGIPLSIIGDPHFFSRITWNLLSNSLKFTENASVLLSLKYDINNNNIIIIVKDTGIGYVPEEEKTLFEAFPTLIVNVNRPPPGFGACLTIVKRMVEMLNGTINYHTKVNFGTTFIVTLPFEPGYCCYFSPRQKAKGFQIMLLTKNLFYENCFEEHCNYYGLQSIENENEIITSKFILIICDENDLDKAKNYKQKYQSLKVLVTYTNKEILEKYNNDNELNDFTFVFIHTFWMKFHGIITHIVLNSKDYEKSVTTASNDFRILIAEDNQMNQWVIKKLLEKMGRKFVIVSNGRECIDTLKKEKGFNVIFMDHHMPIMDGPEAAEEIRKSDDWYKDIPIVAMTANSAKEDEDQCMGAGMNMFVSKPITTLKLENCINFAVSHPFNAK
ncbi:Response regulator receiver domain containing protein [Histomonas meleagridis]|uniref:Response regulator receiver domain containing protein n=1 Tax=Histomonas meleagridis TaxID=135588 RepID=UPI003559E20F|nr:Response regulator receiver domain containing protein [Histomonas meleagridis]KAH0800795.1 Response regulator receiver domain containing protein [Histomonas meleagridis]